jgi:hypothetical protein
VIGESDQLVVEIEKEEQA